ncbi:high-potential iron-sulfur protein [Thiorhodospira sibirica]|uniref:high-potential iron-sulfur protein n=1 Tax=Thiorhodospira sibirica TaxID=154347 RepID=UPI00022C0AB1|nr:high-potential iron-sulfur protein [Thiorhodospira sibirica]
MTDSKKSVTRRHFLKLGVAGLVAVPVASLVMRPVAAAQKLTENDPVAQAMAYKHAAADAAGHPKFQEGRTCENCLLYKPDAGTAGWGSCSVFPGKLVAAEGWCSAWVPQR